MAKHPILSICPHCGSQSVEFLDKRRPAPAKGEPNRWRCLSSRCGRSFKNAEPALRRSASTRRAVI